ncbi:hypothetical protein PVK06_035595 [Gossypium arboreum]|uniref:Reverse transcriptase n=1 Tax=Gossypium arboreum TaxID=29729 RepID=A0ABR0NI60_GOSAR|nr:hypothetical protein PVK06_035595 [Gossypium arboreum]
MIHDNFFIAHELLRYIQSSKNGSNKGFVIKLDMSKAYNCVEWDFLEKVMIRRGFSASWVTLVIRCLQSVKYVVKCNTSFMDVIIFERGLWQVFLVHRGTLDVMISRMMSFWWAKKNKDSGLAIMVWDSLCTLKGVGGIGFRDLRLFNIVLLV